MIAVFLQFPVLFCRSFFPFTKLNYSILGAFEGLAPICKVNPLLATSCTFKDCMCAVKVLSALADDIARDDFIQVSKLWQCLKFRNNESSECNFVL